MDNLYAPWRGVYFENKPDGCIFCHIAAHAADDDTNKVFYRDSLCYGVMNKYPYTPGHCMLIPLVHVDSPTLLDDSHWLHLNTLARALCSLLLEGYGAQGVNMGANIRQSAGAGIPDHLHLHFVPRYRGDTNFITAIADSRVYGVDFEQIFTKIKQLGDRFLAPLRA